MTDILSCAMFCATAIKCGVVKVHLSVFRVCQDYNIHSEHEFKSLLQYSFKKALSVFIVSAEN